MLVWGIIRLMVAPGAGTIKAPHRRLTRPAGPIGERGLIQTGTPPVPAAAAPAGRRALEHRQSQTAASATAATAPDGQATFQTYRAEGTANQTFRAVRCLRYHPRFTLASDISSDEKTAVHSEIEKLARRMPK